MAVFVDLIRKIFALSDRKSLARKELGLAREQANASHTMALRLGQQSFHQPATTTFSLGPGGNCDGTNFREVRAIQMQRSTTNDAAAIFQHHEVSDVLAEFRHRARQQSAVAGVGCDQLVNLFCVRQDCFTRAHEPPREESRFSV